MNTPAARNSDPSTSHLADRYITETGIRCKQCEFVELLVRKRPNYTARELAAITKADFEMLHKRLPECKNVKKGDVVTCLVSGRKATTWVMA